MQNAAEHSSSHVTCNHGEPPSQSLGIFHVQVTIYRVGLIKIRQLARALMSRARGGWDGAIDTAYAALRLVRTMVHRLG